MRFPDFSSIIIWNLQVSNNILDGKSALFFMATSTENFEISNLTSLNNIFKKGSSLFKI